MRRPAAIIALVWLLTGLYLTLRPIPSLEGISPDNAIPFDTILRYLANPLTPGTVGQVVGNLLLLAAIGFPAPLAFPWLDRWWRVLLAALALSVAIELIQLPLPGRAGDVDDVLLNVIGALVAYGIGRLMRSAERRVDEG